MTSLDKRKLAELSLLFGVPIFTNATDHSRLAGLQRKLQKIILPDLADLTRRGGMTDAEIHAIDDQIEAWLKNTGWWHNSAHVAELVSFCMDVINESPIKYYPLVLDSLILIAEHLDNGKEFHPPTTEDREALLASWKNIYA